MEDVTRHEDVLDDVELEGFDTTEYLRCSGNNMPRFAPLVPLTTAQQEAIDSAI